MLFVISLSLPLLSVACNRENFIYLTCLQPEQPPIATVTFVHGYGEYIDRYSHVFPRFADAGIKVNSFDQRGILTNIYSVVMWDGTLLKFRPWEIRRYKRPFSLYRAIFRRYIYYTI